ncbi:MAG: calcium-binding protein, partial [Cyanobacteriota bacterium]|nr:calcium-binding protein [Cyanobacteriota bacterium]
GDDTLDGGSGNDTADYSALGQAITLERAGAINKGSAGTDQILNLETIIGATGEENAIDGSTGISGTTSFDIDLSQETFTVNNIPVLGDQTFEIINFVNATGTSNDDDIVGNDSDNVFGGSEGDDTFDGQDGDDTIDYSDLGRAITLERGGVIDKGNAGEDNILNIETVIGAEGRDNAIDGSTGISGQTSFVANLADETFTVRNLPGLGNLDFNVVNFVDITGTSEADDLVGDRQENELRGEDGRDTLVGGAGDDRILGGRGRDSLTGVDPNSANPGAGEVDIIDGGRGRDTIVLGDGSNVFYSFAGSSDFADIQGFQAGRDTIELTGAIGDYFFNSDNTAIFLSANNDLIAEFTNGAFAASDLNFV